MVKLKDQANNNNLSIYNIIKNKIIGYNNLSEIQRVDKTKHIVKGLLSNSTLTNKSKYNKISTKNKTIKKVTIFKSQDNYLKLLNCSTYAASINAGPSVTRLSRMKDQLILNQKGKAIKYNESTLTEASLVSKAILNSANNINLLAQINPNYNIVNKKEDKVNNIKNIAKFANNLAIKAKKDTIEKKIRKLNLVKLRTLLNNLCKFNAEIAKNQYLYYYFNKSNKILIHPFKYAYKLLSLAFLAMGCLISRPVFKLVYTRNRLSSSDQYKVKPQKKIIIQLFYFIRSSTFFLQGESYLFTNATDSNFKQEPALGYPRSVDRACVDSAKPPDRNPSPVLRSKERWTRSLDRRESQMINTKSPFFSLTAPISMKGSGSKLKFNDILKKTILAKYKDKFLFLAYQLTKIFGCEVQLELVRVSKPHFDSHILVQQLGLNSYKNGFGSLIAKLFREMKIKKALSNQESKSFSLFNSTLTGIKVRLGGRTFKQKVIARKSVRHTQKGSLSRTYVKYLDTARFTGKTRIGAYSFTVTLGHVF